MAVQLTRIHPLTTGAFRIRLPHRSRRRAVRAGSPWAEADERLATASEIEQLRARPLTRVG